MDIEVTPKRGTYAPSRKRREQIAAAVVAIVDRDGHDSLTVAGVAEAAGTSEGTVLYHFPSKDDLFVGAMQLLDDRAAAEAHADDDPTIDPEALKADLPNLHRLRLTAVLRGSAAMPGHPAAAYFARRSEHQLAIFTRAIQKRQRDGLAHPNLDPEHAARQIIALWDGLTSAWMIDPTVDVPGSLADGIRLLTGENWMRARALLDRDDFGL